MTKTGSRVLLRKINEHWRLGMPTGCIQPVAPSFICINVKLSVVHRIFSTP